MRCPKCTSIEDKVIDSRISREGNTIRRRRECLECGHRFTTTEGLVRDGLGPSGRRLLDLMPRYRLDPPALDALKAYLATLS